MAGTAKEKLFELISDMNGSSEDEVPSIVGMEYGGGLDDVYMNRRRSSAFAAPDATSAFASPMSMGGLPTIYRQDGGGTSDEDWSDYDWSSVYGTPTSEEAAASAGRGANENDWTDPANWANTGLDDPTITTTPSAPSAPTSDAGEDIPDFAYGVTSDGRIDLFGPEGRVNPNDYDGPARSMLLSTLRDMTGNWPDAERAFENMTTPEIMNFERAYLGNPSLDGSTGYRFGGPAGTLQDIFENRASDQLGSDLQNILKEDKKKRQEDKEFEDFRAGYLGEEVSEGFMDRIGLGGLYDSLANMFSIQGEASPRTLEEIETILPQGATFTPVNSFMAGVMDFALPSVAKGLANLTGAGKTIGTITTADGMSFNLSDTGKLSMNMPMSEYDEGSDAAPVRRTVKKKKETKEEKKEPPKTGMAALLARRPAPKDRLDTLAGSQDIYKRIYNRPFRTV